MHDAKDVSSPLVPSLKLTLHDGTLSTDATLYRQVLGSMQYLSLTRPDISFAVNKLSQFMHQPTITHWSAVKRVLRYLKGTSDHGILIRKTSPSTLHAYADADWATNFNDRTSTSGYVVFLGSNSVSWSSKKQSVRS